MTMFAQTTKPYLRKNGIYWLCRSWVPVMVNDVMTWIPRLGWSCISKEKAYENWKLAISGDLNCQLEYVTNPSINASQSGC